MTIHKTMMTPEVQQAVDEIKTAFSNHTIEVSEVGDGGACVVIQDVFIGDQYEPCNTWVGFIIGFQYPRADVYPHYVTSELKRKNGESLGEGFSGPTEWQDRQAIQISRSSKRLNPLIDTALTKLAKVIEWVKSR